VFPAGERFDAGAIVPGLDDVSVGGTGLPVPEGVEAEIPRAGVVAEPLPDHYGVAYALAADEADVGGDGVTDGYDVVVHGARALAAEPATTGDAAGLSP
jgi:hypothetical protein